jgi:hypothetical protein
MWRTFSLAAVAAAAATALLAPTASASPAASARAADPPPQPGNVIDAANQSIGALEYHLYMYHLSRPTWEVQDLIQHPRQNIQLHVHLIKQMTDPFIDVLP